eukprot:403331469
MIFLIVSLIVNLSQAALPTQYLSWNFYNVDAAGDVINTIASSGGPAPQFNKQYLLTPAAILSKTGFLFESDNVGCAAPHPSFNTGVTFTFTAWVYITDLTTEQTIWCKLMILPTYVSTPRVCVKIKGTTIWAGVNAAGSSAAGTLVETNTFVKPSLGWNFVAVGFDVTGSVSTVQAWVYKPDATSQIGTTVSFTVQLQDATSFMACIGGILTCSTCTATSTYSVTLGFKGVINNIRIYNYKLTNAQVFGSISNSACSSECRLCRIEDNGQCIEKQQSQIMVQIDFNVPDYRQLVEDQSPNKNDFQLNKVAATDPYFVHQQGLFFNGLTKIVSKSAIRFARASFTQEFWFRPYQNLGSGQLLMRKASSATAYKFSVGFNQNINYQVAVTLDATTIYFTISYKQIVDMYKWHFLQVALIKQTTTTNQVCIYYNKDGVLCSGTIFPTAFADSGTNLIDLGFGFQGMIRLYHVYDYPKLYYSTDYQIYQSTACTKFSTTQCDQCDNNFARTCFSDCNPGEYGGKCTSCSTKCNTCYDSAVYSCFSCDETTHKIFYADTFCKEVCGDGFNYGTFECDDGNTNNNDGCSSSCKVEQGYKCSGGSSSTPDVCTEICGDGMSVGILACDDGNLIDNDGCSSTCTVESGWYCQTTADKSKSDCYEFCGDLQYFGKKSTVSRFKFACDDGNLVNGDGCNQYCQQEIGFKCDAGGACKEICGDGIAYTDSCDDGNNDSGDGCSSTCTVEPGYACILLADSTMSCYQAFGPRITGHSLSRDDTEIVVYLNESVLFSYNFDSSRSIKYYISGSQSSYNVDIRFVNDIAINQKTPTSQLSFSLSFGEEVQLFGDEKFIIEFQRDDFISSSTSASLTDTSYSIQMYGREIQGQGASSGFGLIIAFAWLLLVVIWIVLGIKGFPIAAIWHLTTALQTAQILPLTQSNMSTEGRTIGKSFEYVNFHVSFFLEMITSDLKSNPSTPYKYYSFSYGSYNVFTLMIDLFLIVGIVVAAALGLAFVLGKPNKRYTSARIKESLLIFMGSICFNKIMFLGMFGAGNLEAGGSTAVAGGVILIILGLAFIGFQGSQLIIYRNEINEGKSSPAKRWRGFFGYFNQNAQSQAFYTWIGYIFMVKPYKEKYFNIMALTDEVGTLICIALFANTIFINSGMTRNVHRIIGYAYGGVVSIVIVLNYLFTFTYFKKRSPPQLELTQDYTIPATTFQQNAPKKMMQMTTPKKPLMSERKPLNETMDADLKKPQQKLPQSKTQSQKQQPMNNKQQQKPPENKAPPKRKPSKVDESSYYEEEIEVTEDYDDLPGGDITDGTRGAIRKPYGRDARLQDTLADTQTSDQFQGSSTFNNKKVKFA